MWFEPLKINSRNDLPAILAIPAIYPPDISKPTPETGRNSRNSENSNVVICENNKSDSSKIAEIARIAAHRDIEKPVICGQCLHFKCYNAHGKGAGRCLAGGAYGAWSETTHHCTNFNGYALLSY